jgi:hypothetical protein
MRNPILPTHFIAGLLLAVFSLAACGIKGPPVPPVSRLQLPDVRLSYRVAGDRVILTWRLSADPDATLAEDASFGVYRSRWAANEPACDTCPLVVEKIASIPYVQGDDDWLSASPAIDPGYRYAFKVRLEARGTPGADSNTVRFAIAADGTPTATEVP